jgi:undecaprenyl-diphosphatase
MHESGSPMNTPSHLSSLRTFPPPPRPAALEPERFFFAAFLVLLAVTVALARGTYDSELLLGIYSGGGGEFVEFWKFITRIGSNWILLAIVILFGALLVRVGRKDHALWLIAGWAMTSSIVETLKWTIARTRPPVRFLTSAAGAAFPSGHAAESLYVFFYLWMILQGSVCLRRRGVLGAFLGEFCSVVLAVATALVGYSRLYLGVHWPSDVLGGWAIGCFSLSIAFLNAPPQEEVGSEEAEVGR